MEHSCSQPAPALSPTPVPMYPSRAASAFDAPQESVSEGTWGFSPRLVAPTAKGLPGNTAGILRQKQSQETPVPGQAELLAGSPRSCIPGEPEWEQDPGGGPGGSPGEAARRTTGPSMPGRAPHLPGERLFLSAGPRERCPRAPPPPPRREQRPAVSAPRDPPCTEPPALPVSHPPLRGAPGPRCHRAHCPRRSPGGVTGGGCPCPLENLPPSRGPRLPPPPRSHSWAPTRFHTSLPEPSPLARDVPRLRPGVSGVLGAGVASAAAAWGGGSGVSALWGSRCPNQEVCRGAGRVFLLYGKRLMVLRVFLQGEGNPRADQSATRVLGVTTEQS